MFMFMSTWQLIYVGIDVYVGIFDVFQIGVSFLFVLVMILIGFYFSDLSNFNACHPVVLIRLMMQIIVCVNLMIWYLHTGVV